MTPEKKVKNKVVEILKQFGCYYFYPVTGGYGSNGIPDIVACLHGEFIGIECKSGTNKPTALQLRNLEDIKRAGGSTLVVNEDNLEHLRRILKRIDDNHRL
tara:strand:+ start:201 stop:503 length:303 start_codon:yes stop_codon:yes gene_type:complete